MNISKAAHVDIVLNRAIVNFFIFIGKVSVKLVFGGSIYIEKVPLILLFYGK